MRALLHKVAAALYAVGPFGVLLLGAVDSFGIPLVETDVAARSVIAVGKEG